MSAYVVVSSFFFFNDTATTEIYTLSLHDALPICSARLEVREPGRAREKARCLDGRSSVPVLSAEEPRARRSEEHTSELQSRLHLVCRLLLEKKKQYASQHTMNHINHTIDMRADLA